MLYSQVAQHARLVFIGILLFVIAYQLWVARARRTEPILYTVAAWAAAALVAVVGRSVQHATHDPGTVLLGSRIFHTGVLALVPLGFLLMHELRGAPRERLFRVCMVGSTVPVILVWSGNLIVSDQTRSFQTLAGTILGPEPAPFGPLGIPYVVAIGAYLLHVARRGRRDLQWHQRLPLQVAVLLLLPAFVNDVLLYAGSLVTIELASVGLFAHVMAINVVIFTRARQLFSDLEREVDERTVELRAREQELSQMLKSRRRMLDAIPDTVCLLNGSRFDYVNEAGARFFGKPSTELVGSMFTHHVVEGQVVEAERHLATIAESSRPALPVELRFYGPENLGRTGEVAGLMLELDDGPRTLIAIRDMTERQRLMAKLQMADRLASVGTLAAGIAHEINNPMAFIVGNLEVMKRAAKTNPEIAAAYDGPDGFAQLVDECLIGAERIVRIVRDLRLFARAGDESSVLEIPVILDQALKIAMVTIRHRAEVTIDYGPVPPVKAVAGQLAQVFLNLLINASQAIPDDGTRHSIRVSTSTSVDGWAVIEIADDGVGIAPELLTTVFDPFVTTKPIGTGTGLGLFICHGIVTALGGDIRFLPHQPRGAIAQVTLPPLNHAPVTPSHGTDQTEPSLSRPGNIRVLIVDDEDIALSVLRRQLREYAVTTVASGSAAIARLEAEDYDVVLCDLAMPGCNGMEVWKQARRLGYEDRFVFITAGAVTEALRDFTEGVPAPCLTKPVALTDLEAAIQAAVARSRMRPSTS